MKRTKNNQQATAILSADLHLRDDIPVCRTDDFTQTLVSKMDFLNALQKKHQCPVLAAGDIFHKWKPSPYLLSLCFEHLPDNMIVIPGQHDLPQHNIDAIDKSGLHVLEKGGKLKVLSEGETINIDYGITVHGFPFGSKLRANTESDGIHIAMIHTLTWKGIGRTPEYEADDGRKILKKMSGFDLVLVGDNHQTFTVQQSERILLSPGSFTRQEAGQMDFKPRVYLYYADTNTIKIEYIPIQSGAITRDHIERNEERDERISAFVTKLDGDWSVGTSFEGNLTEFFKTNQVRKTVKQIIYNSMDHERNSVR